MPKIQPKSVSAYLAALPADRRREISRVRAVVNESLPRGYEEGILFGMISWYVPLSEFADTYNGQPLTVVSLASQKSYMSLYLMCVYGSPEHAAWFKKAWAATGKKLDMGKSCVRFHAADDLALDVIAKALAPVDPERFVTIYGAAYAKTKTGAKKTKAKAKPRARSRA